jgi:hypothetical protein
MEEEDMFPRVGEEDNLEAALEEEMNQMMREAD